MEQCNIKTLMCMNIKTEKRFTKKLPLFYQEVIFSWNLCGGGSKAPQSQTENRKQLIWGNKMIHSKGRTLFYKNWYAKNLIFIDDLLDQNGNLKSGEEIFCLLERSNRNNWLIEYKTILKALPATWKQTLTNVNMQVKVKRN